MVRNFAKTTFFYGLSTAINKGLVLIALPFLGEILSVEEFGIWALVQTLVALGAPVLSLNGFSAIIREGVDNEERGYSIFIKYLQFTVLLGLLFCISALILTAGWVLYTVLLLTVGAFHLILSGWYRARDRHVSYLLVSLIKLIALFSSIYLIWESPNLLDLLKYQFIVGGVLLSFLFIIEVYAKKVAHRIANLREVLLFSVFLIPNGLAQWILSGSDRIIIQRILNDFELGRYSLAYSIALVLMIVNSGLALTLPNYIIKNYEKWISGNVKSKIMVAYGGLSCLISAVIFGSIPFLKNHISILAEVDYELEIITLILILGFYVLGAYYLFVNILFYHRKAKTISKITTVTAIFNVVGTIFLVGEIGILGAAVITALSYLLYCGLAIFMALRLEPRLRRNLGNEMMTVLLFGVLLAAVSYLCITVF